VRSMLQLVAMEMRTGDRAGGQTDIAGWGSSSIDLPLGEAQRGWNNPNSLRAAKRTTTLATNPSLPDTRLWGALFPVKAYTGEPIPHPKSQSH
jgi:hypothetical protein